MAPYVFSTAIKNNFVSSNAYTITDLRRRGVSPNDYNWKRGEGGGLNKDKKLWCNSWIAPNQDLETEPALAQDCLCPWKATRFAWVCQKKYGLPPQKCNILCFSWVCIIGHLWGKGPWCPCLIYPFPSHFSKSMKENKKVPTIQLWYVVLWQG